MLEDNLKNPAPRAVACRQGHGAGAQGGARAFLKELKSETRTENAIGAGREAAANRTVFEPCRESEPGGHTREHLALDQNAGLDRDGAAGAIAAEDRTVIAEENTW